MHGGVGVLTGGVVVGVRMPEPELWVARPCVVARVGIEHDLHVLLRHRSRSIPQLRSWLSATVTTGPEKTSARCGALARPGGTAGHIRGTGAAVSGPWRRSADMS